MPTIFKHSLIALIHKDKLSHRFVEFRHISLCNTFYKIITKVLANRMKKVLSFIINDSQYTFMKGKDISKNITLAHELCNDLHHNKFVAKLDLLTAFNMINKGSLLHLLHIIGFPNHLIKLIKACISNVLFFVILNGEIH